MTRHGQQLSLAVHLVAAQARDRRLVRQFGPQQTPRTAGIERRHQVANAAFEMHAVAAQAIVHQQALPVVLFVQKQPPVSGAVRSRLPLGELLPVARAAALHQARNIPRAQTHGVAEPLPHMLHQAPQISQMETCVQRGDLPVTCAARYVAMAGRMPGIVVLADLVAARAGSAGVVLVIEAPRRERQDSGGGNGQQRAAQNPALHTLRSLRSLTMRALAGYAVPMMVSTGLTPPLVTCTLPSITYKLS